MADLSAGEPIFFDLSDRMRLRVSGADRERFLNGQITNDLRNATVTRAIEACVLNTKGKIDAHIFVTADGESYLLDADAELRDALPARLDRYIIADDVQVEDVSERFALFHFLGPRKPELPNEFNQVRARRFLTEGWDIWSIASDRARVGEILSKEAALCDAADAENLRIESGLPRWERELTGEIIPLEANLEERCVDYGKGCYIGQEVISRMKMSGQTNKRLCGLISVDGSPLEISTRLTSPNDQRDAGWITSTTFSRRLQKNIALAFVKRGYNTAGTALQISTAQRVEVVPLPFV